MPRLSSFSSRGLTGIGIINDTLPLPVDIVPTTAMPANQTITDWDTVNGSLITRSVNNSSTFFVSQGSSWESRTLPPLIYPSGGQSIRYYNGFVYAVVTPGSPTFFREIYRSTDYQTWDLVSAPGIGTNWWIDINETTGRFLATSGSTNALTSSNGSSWTVVSLPAAATNLIFGTKGWNGNTVVAANYGSTTNHLYRSTDNGANWSSVADSTTWSSVPENNRRYAQSVANKGSRFIALIGQGNRRMSISTDDGATWTTPEINTQWDDFASNIFFSRVKNKFVVTNIGSNSNVVSYSTNGAVGNWSTTSTLPANVTFIVESATRVYGGSTAGIIVDLTNLI